MSDFTTTSEPTAPPNEYIILLKRNLPEDTVQEHYRWMTDYCAEKTAEGHPSALKETFNSFSGCFQGYTAEIYPDSIPDILQTGVVDLVEPDYYTYGTSSLTVQQNVPSWGLARLSSLVQVTKDTMNYWYDAEAAGQGVVAYVLDTGLFTLHDDFEGRASFGANFVGGLDDDRYGHGTHVAAIIGGKTYGVAKQIKLIGVKVLGDNNKGKVSQARSGLEWVVNHVRDNFGAGKYVVNMSLVTRERSECLNQYVHEVVTDAGITIVTGAGNDMGPAIGSPASEESAITVGATTDEDRMWGLSNYGDNVDIFAPGGEITSAWIPGKGKSNTNGSLEKSGTSMATAHVSGLAACVVSSKTFEGGPEEVRKRILDMAQTLSIRASKSNLANNGLGCSHVLPID